MSVIGLGEKLLLFRHEPGYENILRKLTEQDTLQDGDMVEVVLAGESVCVCVCEEFTLTARLWICFLLRT